MQELLGKLGFNIGTTGFSKIDKNYNDVATEVGQRIENEYFNLTLESMAADSAYLIYEYVLSMTDKGMEKIGEIPYTEKYGYGIRIENDIYINDEEIINVTQRNIEKISDTKLRIVDIVGIANIKGSTLDVKQKINNLSMFKTYEVENEIGTMKQSKSLLNIDIGKEIDAKVNFENREEKILAEKELPNGSKVYIEAIANSKFENYVLARTVTAPKTVAEINDRSKEFMIEDSQFAICDQNDNPVPFEYIRLEDYQEQVLPDGTYKKYDYKTIKDTDLVRTQEVQLIKLRFNESEVPEKLKVLPVNRKLYSDKNDSEYNFYKNEDWYQVKTGNVNITEENGIGGSVTITKIEETDDEIIFYYDTKGYVLENMDFALRVKSSEREMNYTWPNEYERKNVNSNENKLIYLKDYSKHSGGAPILEYKGYNSLKELEFALFYNAKLEALSEPLEFNWDSTESNQIAKIQDIKYLDYVIDINEELEQENGCFKFKGIITEVNDKYLKFFTESEDKEYILSNPKNYEYTNGRNYEDINFSEIEVGDYIETWLYGGTLFTKTNGETEFFKKITIVKNKKGEELKKELVRELAPTVYGFRVGYNTVTVKNIEIINDSKAIITIEIAEAFRNELHNDEKFEIKVIVNEDTLIYRSSYDKEQLYSISELENVEYVPDRVKVQLDGNTLNDEMPVVTQIELDI